MPATMYQPCVHPRSQSVPLPPSPSSPLTAGSLFSGMGGFAAGFRAAGFTLSWATDHDESAATTFRHRFPDVPFVQKDIRQLSVATDGLVPVDVLSAGFPCQSFSQAGTRRGFEDPRGQLFFEIPRIIAEFATRQRPRLLVLENVPYLLSGAKHVWFDQVQRGIRRAGYWFRRESCWVVNVKDATPLPQDRERLFMVAASREHFSYNPFRPPVPNGSEHPGRIRLDDVLDREQRASPDAYLSEDNRYFKMIAGAMDRGSSKDNIYQLRRSYVREKKQGLCPTLTANMGIGGHNVPFVRDRWGIRRLTVTEVARLQGFEGEEDLFPVIPVQQRYRLLGNAVCVGLAHSVARICVDILRGHLACDE